MKRKHTVTGILTAALVALSGCMMQGCQGEQDPGESIVLETDTFMLTLGKDAVA